MSSRVCPHCGCSDIDIDTARGDAVCTSCGSVLEDNIIVSEVQFAETGMGGSSVIGQFVSSEGGKSHIMGSGFHHGFGKESREITLQNGKRRIQQLGDQLRLNQHCIDTAYNFFKMAVNRRLTRGRKTTHVIAACLYLVCRTEGTPHMLLDFSDVLQINVYLLGRTYLQLSRELCINIPALDPCLYIHRFAHKLEFGDKTHEVSMTALRLVSRMKRDWMAQGRRPSGLCGAALLVASRIHDFNRNVRELIKVVKIGEGTIRKRLAEFSQTPSSQLTIDEFQKIDLEEEMDPPCFTEGKRKAKLTQLEENGQLQALTSEITDLQVEIDRILDEATLKKSRRKKDPESASLCSTTPSVADLDDDLVDATSFLSKETLKEALTDTQQTATTDSVDTGALSPDTTTAAVGLSSTSSSLDHKMPKTEVITSSTGSDTCEQRDPDVEKLEQQELKELLMPAEESGMGPRPTAASLGLKASIEECMKLNNADDENTESGELDMTGIDESEMELYILSETEVKVKTRMWHLANADYLKELKAKEEKEAQDREAGIIKPETKKRKKPRKKGSNREAHSAGEAIEKMLQERKISSKINYDVLRDLNKTESKPATTNIKLESAAAVLGSGPIEAMPVNLRQLEKRFRRPSMSEQKPLVKQEEPPEKKPKIVEQEVIIESGPIQYDHEEEEEYEEEYEEEDNMSAARLMGHTEGEDYGYGNEYEDDMD